jgi:hypothetical protein
MNMRRSARYGASDMAKLALVYGLRMLPSDELASVGNAEVKLRNGNTAGVTMHLIEGSSEEEIRRQLLQSLDAFFDFYPEI